MKHKFGIEIPVESVRELPVEEFKRLVYEKADAAYREREAEYPVMAGLSHFTARDATGHKRYEREGLVEWARKRFQVDLDLEDLKNRQRDEIRDLLVAHSRQYTATAVDPQVEVRDPLETGLRRPGAFAQGAATRPWTTAASRAWPIGSTET